MFVGGGVTLNYTSPVRNICSQRLKKYIYNNYTSAGHISRLHSRATLMGYRFVAACKFPEDAPPSLPLRKTGKVGVMSSSLQRAAARRVSGRSSVFCSLGFFFPPFSSGSDSCGRVKKLHVKMLRREPGVVNRCLAGSPSSLLLRPCTQRPIAPI